MALPGSGTMTSAQWLAEFGVSAPKNASDFYRGGAIVPDSPENAAIPTSGTMTGANFYGASARSFSLAAIDDTVGDVNFGATALFTLVLESDGDIVEANHFFPSGFDLGNWTTPITGGVGSGYESRFSKNSGDNPTSGTLATWQVLSSNRSWNWTQNSAGIKAGNYTVEIRNASTLAVVASKTFDLEIEYI